MKVLSYLASLLCLYLVVQAWDSLWDIHFLLPDRYCGGSSDDSYGVSGDSGR